MPQPSLLDLLSVMFTDALVIHDGKMLAVCPLDEKAEDKLRQLIESDTTNILPPGLALVTSGTRAADTLRLLSENGLSMDIQCGDAAVATELRDAVIAGVKARGEKNAELFVSPVFDRTPPKGLDPRRN